jgi:hypothetical protein
MPEYWQEVTIFASISNVLRNILHQQIKSRSKRLGPFRNLEANPRAPDRVQENHSAKLELITLASCFFSWRTPT